MKRRKKYILMAAAVCAVLLAVVLVFGFQNRLTVRTYTIESDAVTENVRIAMLSDLHSCNYGQGQEELISAVEEQEPDLVVLSGDIVDDENRMDAEKAYETVRALAERWPAYYVTGNHEFWSGEPEDIKARIQGCGAVVLAGETATLTVRGQRILIAGLDDPEVGESAWQAQFASVSGAAGEEDVSILLSHRPERTEFYRASNFDLVLAGHAHGGQWRLPGLVNGLIAPNQGLFPKYAGGQYDLDGTAMIVSRGLARESTRIPRIFNPPELVLVVVSAP